MAKKFQNRGVPLVDLIGELEEALAGERVFGGVGGTGRAALDDQVAAFPGVDGEIADADGARCGG